MNPDESKKWNIEKESIKSPGFPKLKARFDAAKVQMNARTRHHELYGLLTKNKSIHDLSGKRSAKYFSEGTTQYIMRKALSDTIQRVPDGELETPFDKNSPESIVLQYLFENKVCWSEYNGIDMFSNLTNTFKYAFTYGFAPVRVGWEKDYDDDLRITYNLENWNDVFINPDCPDIRNAQVVYHRQYLTEDDFKALLDDDDNLIDSTYNEDVVKYVIENRLWSSRQWESEKLGDQLKGSTSTNSVEIITEYRRGSSQFVSWVPACNAKLRTVKNHDPRKEIPWLFCVLETDPDWPLGLSQVEFLLADQQFNDLHQTAAYKNIMLAMEPPIMVAGWETNPKSYKFEPRKIWNLGNNPNNVKVEPVKIDNGILSGWSQTREATSSNMLRNLNMMDGTIAADSGTGYSKTAPGVDAQKEAKTVNINQYQKRMEYFYSAWCNMALRLYLESQGGEHEITVDEEVRLRLLDAGALHMLDDDDYTVIHVDFDNLSIKGCEFKVRAGSLVEQKKDQEKQNLLDLMHPIVQNLNGWSDENRSIMENEILMPIFKRIIELSDVDISQSMGDSLSGRIAQAMMGDMQAQIDQQGAQQMVQQQQIDQLMQGAPEQAPMPGETPPPPPAPPQQDVPQDVIEMPTVEEEPELILEESPGQQVNVPEDLLLM